jgi:hypothetical protein
LRDTKSAFPQQSPQPPRGASKSSGPTPANPKKIDLAVALLRSEHAAGERAAAEVEAKALCAAQALLAAGSTIDRLVQVRVW